MRLSTNFTLEEFTTSQEAVRRGIDNTPSQQIVEELKRLCNDALEPIRKAAGRSVIVFSGYRCPDLNLVIKGSPRSAHMFGLAADIFVPGVPVRKVCEIAASLSLPFDQLIDEFGRWTHIAIASKGAKPRGQQLEARHVKNLVTYAPVSFINGG